MSPSTKQAIVEATVKALEVELDQLQTSEDSLQEDNKVKGSIDIKISF